MKLLTGHKSMLCFYVKFIVYFLELDYFSRRNKNPSQN